MLIIIKGAYGVCPTSLCTNRYMFQKNLSYSPNTWVHIKRIDQELKITTHQNQNGKYCLVALICSQIASRIWGRYEIQKAWEETRVVVRVYILINKDQFTIFTKGDVERHKNWTVVNGKIVKFAGSM